MKPMNAAARAKPSSPIDSDPATKAISAEVERVVYYFVMKKASAATPKFSCAVCSVFDGC